MSIEHFKDGEAETLRRVLVVLNNLALNHNVMIPKSRLEKVVENLLKLESGIDSSLILGGVPDYIRQEAAEGADETV